LNASGRIVLFAAGRGVRYPARKLSVVTSNNRPEADFQNRFLMMKNMINWYKLLNNIATIALFMSSAMGINSYADNQNDSGAKIIFGEKVKVCQDAIALLNGANKSDFEYDKMPSMFDGTEWAQLYEMQGWEYAKSDIYNDGTSNVILAETGMFRSHNWRWLFTMQPNDFLEAHKSKKFEFSKLAQLSPANQVVSTSGKTTVPIWSDIWHHGSKNYIVMKEFYFATEPNDDDPSYDPNTKYKFNSLYIGILDSSSKKYDADFKVIRLSPKMVCQITWE
jgi:hypothetical protein